MQFSVVIPCHNAERWIGAAVASVHAQTFPAHEIIVVDDSSTDGSVGIVRASSGATRLLSCSARNAAAARNIGIHAATGDWIALLDADDVWYPNHLARARELLQKSGDRTYMSNHHWIGLQSERLAIPDEHHCKLPAPAHSLDVEDFFHLASNGFHFGHSTVVYNRNAVLDAGLFDPSQKRRHDTDLWLRMISGGGWTYDTAFTAGYRENTPNSISRAELECDYFYLRTLTRNLGATPGPAQLRYLARQCRRALGISMTCGDAEHYSRVRDLAMPHLSWKLRVSYGIAERAPHLAASMLKAKRYMSQRMSSGGPDNAMPGAGHG